MNQLTQQRERLLRQCTEVPAGQVEVQEQLLERLASMQHMYQLCATIFVLSCNCSLMTTEQFASYMIASHPWCPSLTALHNSLKAIRGERQGQASRGSASQQRQQAKQLQRKKSD